jgi:hypothetical protein
MKEIEKSETREGRGRTLNLPLHAYFTLFITILIGLNYPTFLFYMSGQKDIFLLSEFRHDYARNYTIPLSSTSYLCPNKTDTQFTVKEMEKKKL